MSMHHLGAEGEPPADAPFDPIAALRELDPSLAAPVPVPLEELLPVTDEADDVPPFEGFKVFNAEDFEKLVADLQVGETMAVPMHAVHPSFLPELGCPYPVDTREGYLDFLINFGFPPEMVGEIVSAAYGPKDSVSFGTDLGPVPALDFGPQVGINPKDALGMLKPDLSVVPPAAMLHLASAMMDGAAKYGPFNWRGNAVLSRVYVAAAMRHLLQFLDGENFDPVSGVHHLGHAMACAAIVLDAQETGNLADNRPTPGAAGDMIRRWSSDSKFQG